MCRICSWRSARSSASLSALLGGVNDDTRSCLGGFFGAARWPCEARSHYGQPLGCCYVYPDAYPFACRRADSRLWRQAWVSAMTGAARAVGYSRALLKNWGKRSASGRRQALVGKAGGRCGYVVKNEVLVHISMPTPPCPHSAGRAVIRSSLVLGRSASAVVFGVGNVQFPTVNTDRTRRSWEVLS